MRVDWVRCSALVAAITIRSATGLRQQENSKRLLAYSSISNAGYLLLGLIAGNEYGYTGLIIYLLVYTFMNMGAFGVVISLRRRGIIGDNVEDLAGLAQKAPFMAFMMTVFMLSLGGLPVTGGFIGKWFLFGGLLERGKVDGKSWYYWLAGWAILNTVVSFYYYVRFIRVMYIGERIADNRPLALSPALQAALVVALIAIIFVGIYPQPIITGTALTSLGGQSSETTTKFSHRDTEARDNASFFSQISLLFMLCSLCLCGNSCLFSTSSWQSSSGRA